MKTFICSMIIFSILLILIITNSIYIHNTSDKIIEDATSLSVNDIHGINRLCAFWQKHKLIFSISIHDSKVERITGLTENIKSAATAGASAEFKKNIVLLIDLLEELKKIEEISFQGII